MIHRTRAVFRPARVENRVAAVLIFLPLSFLLARSQEGPFQHHFCALQKLILLVPPSVSNLCTRGGKRGERKKSVRRVESCSTAPSSLLQAMTAVS